MKKNYFLVMSAMMLTSTAAFAQSDIVEQAKESSSGDFLDAVMGVLMGLAILWMLGHMIYELFIRKSPFTPIDVDDMKAQRRELGMAEEMTEEEKQECVRIHDENFYTWTPLPDDPEERRIITTKKQLDEATAALEQVKAMKPTDPEIVDAINANIDVLKESSKRVFNGSKTMLVFLAAFAVFMWYVAGWTAMPFCILSGVTYYMASLTPNFMLYRRELNGSNGSGALGWVLGLLSSMIIGAKTIRTTTYYTDGSKSVEDDHTEHQMAWIISIIVTVMLVVFMLVWAAVNYLRNYVFYR